MRFGKKPELKQLVIDKLKFNWSPEQISGWLSVNLSRRKSMQISHETIYKTLYVRSRKTLDHLLAVHLRRAHKMRHSKLHSRSGDRGTIYIVNGVSNEWRSLLKTNGLKASMSRRGNCHDNACAESFSSLLKKEWIDAAHTQLGKLRNPMCSIILSCLQSNTTPWQ